ncbi:MAG: hypothetical protein MUF21_01680 [Gemmatimonadaceae bacterium]|nr:hypothetical protein [Gemmatimonadaceae bacterium]
MAPSVRSGRSRRWFVLSLLSLVVGLVGTGSLVRGGLVWIWGPVAIVGAIGIWAAAIRAVSLPRRVVPE